MTKEAREPFVSEANSDNWFLSLTKLAGPIKDVIGYVSMEFGLPVFGIQKIILEDGTIFHVEGEHDIAYLLSYGQADAAKFKVPLETLREEG